MKRWISILATATALLAQQPTQRMHMPADANPSFEVATIKPSPPDARGGGSGTSPAGRFTAHNTSLQGLMLFAYGLHPRQIEGGPAWFETDRFDIAAQSDTEGSPSKQQLTTMLRKLLADRLQLRFHREKKELAIYAITTVKSGSRLPASTGDPAGPPSASLDPRGHFTARNMNLEEFSEGLQGNILDQPVVDRTGLSEGRST